MIIKFDQYNESIRDKMAPKSKDETDKTMKNILSGKSNVDIIKNYLDFIYGKGKYYLSRQDSYYVFASLLPIEFVYNTTIKLLSDMEKDKKIKSVSDILDSAWNTLKGNNHKFIKYLEDVINSYESNEFKKVMINKLNDKLNIEL